MPRAKGLNRHQYQFLSRLRNHPKRLPAEFWPMDDTLRRWMAEPLFVDRLQSLCESLALRRRLNLALASGRAVRRLVEAVDGPPEVIGGLLAVARQAKQESGGDDPLPAAIQELIDRGERYDR